jgi:murein DD-endopeptidase MepM/ murein hydrolase activator NlpD
MVRERIQRVNADGNPAGKRLTARKKTGSWSWMWLKSRHRHALLAVLLAQLAVTPLAAEPAPAVASAALHRTSAALTERERAVSAHVRLDASGRPAYLARFSDGPRRVPEAHGAPQLRALQLGIGDTAKARWLLSSRPPASLVSAASGVAPRDLLWPVVGGTFGRGFGFTRRVRPEIPHNGVDIGAPTGAIVRAAADGLVVYSDNGLRGYGNCVIILHKNGWLSLYAHAQQTTVQAGYQVQRGERIALVGQTGYAWGPHLHFELRDNGRLRNPERLLVGRKSSELNGPSVELSEPVATAQPQRAASAKARSTGPDGNAKTEIPPHPGSR